MNENFLNFVWQYRLYHPQLRTTEGQQLEVIHPGILNSDAGPDFANARIRLDDTTWAGNIEIHLKSADWYQHNHQNDEAFSNLILHVVFDHDRIINDRNGVPVPTLELRGIINEDVYRRYQYYINNHHWIPCQTDIGRIRPLTMKSWLERLMIERLARKNHELETLLAHNTNNLSETFYQMLAGNFGFKVNEQPFRMLARLVPANILAKHKSSLFQIEALLFGTSGLLSSDYRDAYPMALLHEYRFLQKKYDLVTMEKHLWKFLRLRPVNFPTIRIAQLAALVHGSESMFSRIISTTGVDELRSFFAVEASEYWHTHYNFDKEVPGKPKLLGRSAADNILMNTIVRFLFFYAGHTGQAEYRDRAIDLLLALPAEKNQIISHWNELGVIAVNAFESQALIELKNNYCRTRQCLRCSIGSKLLRSGRE